MGLEDAGRTPTREVRLERSGERVGGWYGSVGLIGLCSLGGSDGLGDLCSLGGLGGWCSSGGLDALRRSLGDQTAPTGTNWLCAAGDVRRRQAVCH